MDVSSLKSNKKNCHCTTEDLALFKKVDQNEEYDQLFRGYDRNRDGVCAVVSLFPPLLLSIASFLFSRKKKIPNRDADKLILIKTLIQHLFLFERTLTPSLLQQLFANIIHKHL